jgi:hypothetical protein
VRFGFFYRTSDSKWIQRFRCKECKKTCSKATFHRWFRQKKRLKNDVLRKHFASHGTIRRAARNFHLNRKTVVKKLLALGFDAECRLRFENSIKRKVHEIEFDDLETFETTKCKPLSVTLAVESGTRRILGLEVSKMPAKGLLVEKAKKYGYRPDNRKSARRRLFKDLQKIVTEDAIIKSDSNPHYREDVLEFFPKAKHIRYLGKRGSLGGQGELKKVKFDPLFSLNHTCAMFRANVSRLTRKTWVTTKNPSHLHAHLMLYAQYHNEHLVK